MTGFLFLDKLSRLFGFFFIFANICFAEVVNNTRLDVNKIFFTEVDKVGDKLFAVGEHGIILSSIEVGKNWQQHEVAYKGLFTSFNFSDSNTGLFVAHDSVLFRTEDGGKSFQKISIQSENSISFMKAKWLSTEDALIVGDFGSVFRSSDGGISWKKEIVIDEKFDRHLYDILVSEQGIFIIGESGTVLFKRNISDDWVLIDVPYAGSFFGGIIHNKEIYFFGMRGNILSTNLDFFDKANSKINSVGFNRYVTPSKLGIMSASVAKDGGLFFFASGGTAYKFFDGLFFKKESILDTVVSSAEYGDFMVFAGLRGIKLSR